jgi:hypothetical protein
VIKKTWDHDNSMKSKLKQNRKLNSNQPKIWKPKMKKDIQFKKKDKKPISKKNKIKYYEASITCLYLSNWFNLIQNKILFFLKSQFNKKRRIKIIEITHIIFKIS